MNKPTAVKRKILFVLQDLETGGAEQLKLTIARCIDRDKYDIVYCCIKRVGAIGKEIINRGGSVVLLNADDKFYNFIATYRLYKLAKKIEPDLIHSALFNANFHARLVGLLLRRPVIIEEHGMYAWKRWYHILIDRLLAKFSYTVIVPSRHARDFLMVQEGLPADKITVLLNCIGPEFLDSNTSRSRQRARLALTEEDFAIGSVGNLRKEKGHSVLLDAFKEVLSRYGGARLFIAGEGPLRGHLVEKARQLNIERNVVFLGSCSNIRGFLKALDLFVMPSLSEGLGIALIESVFAGVPAVASRVGGIKEIAEEVDGLTLIEPNNPAALSKAIVGEIENRRKNNKSILDQKKVKQVFTPEFYIKNLEKIYNQALT